MEVKVSAPVRALGSFLLLVILTGCGGILGEGFSAREGSGVFSTTAIAPCGGMMVKFQRP